jgi:hypothetical protein
MERLSLGFREATTARPLEPGQPRQNKKQGVQQPSTNKKKADSAAARARAAARKQDVGAWRPPHAPLRDIHKQKQSDVLKKKNEGSIPLLLDCLAFLENKEGPKYRSRLIVHMPVNYKSNEQPPLWHGM